MRLSDYNYDLPQILIANRPPKVRGASKLLVLDKNNGMIIDSKYDQISTFLKPGDLLILNDTKVIKARLQATRQDGAKRELIVLEKHSYDNDWYSHHIMYRKKLFVGDILKVGTARIVVEEILGNGLALIKSDKDLLELVDEYGKVPLPPYMHREPTADDVVRYQTIWAREQGSVAAPTASLNMTNEIIDSLIKNGIRTEYLTLHVGLGTFMPIRTDDVEDHHMHQEYFEIPEQTAKAVIDTKKAGGRIIALGTTVARTLEYSSHLINTEIGDISGEANIFIYPGYKFKVIDGLLTNFHTPKSTVLMLTAAFAGWDNLLNAYNHAVRERYHFFSYGDSMLIL